MSPSVLGLLAFVLFGSTALVVKPSVLTATDLVFWRMGTCWILTLFLLLKNSRKSMEHIKEIKKRDLLFTLITGSCIFLNLVFLFKSFKLAPITVAIALFYTGPILTLFLKRKLSKNVFRKHDFIAISLTLSGILILVSNEFGREMTTQLTGMICALLGAVFFGLVPIFQERSGGIDEKVTISIHMAVATLCLLPFSISSVTLFTHRTLVEILILGGLFTFVPFLFWWNALKRQPNLSPFITYMDPFTAAFFGLFVLGDELSPHQVIGALILGTSALYHTRANLVFKPKV